MVKGKLYRQNHTKKYTHTHSEKKRDKGEKKIYILKKGREQPINKQINNDKKL